MIRLESTNKKNITRSVVSQSPTHHFVPLLLYFHVFVLHPHLVQFHVPSSQHILDLFFNSIKGKNKVNGALRRHYSRVERTVLHLESGVMIGP